ncbi:E3 ubiquitin protein ligase HEL2 [Tanacetum coccineum]
MAKELCKALQIIPADTQYTEVPLAAVSSAYQHKDSVCMITKRFYGLVDLLVLGVSSLPTFFEVSNCSAFGIFRSYTTSVFISEQKLYNKAQLKQHRNTGGSEVDGSEIERGGFQGHPLYEFRRTTFYGDNELTLICEMKKHNALEHRGYVSRSKRNAIRQVKYGETLRRFTSSVDENKLALDIAMLRSKIHTLFPFDSKVEFTMTYVDKDGDSVTLTDDDDVECRHLLWRLRSILRR